MFKKQSVPEQLAKTGALVIEKETMAQHTTFRIGGPCDLFVEVMDLKQLKAVLAIAKKNKLPIRIIGKGSNLLVSDKGVDGIVIRLSGKLASISRNGNRIMAGAGASLASVANFAKENGLSGLEFAGGIPGTIGGAIWMNAGAYNGEMSQVVVGVPYLSIQGRLLDAKQGQLGFGYRTSRFQQTGELILGCEMELTPGDPDEIGKQMADFNQRRRDKQPLEYPSAGSTFKRPEGLFAGALIENAGLKGFSVGGAQVSEKHAGFVINKNNATCADVVALIEQVQKTILNKDGVLLEPEIQFWERFSEKE